MQLQSEFSNCNKTADFFPKKTTVAMGLTQLVFCIFVVSIEFSPLSTVELTTNWYQLHNGDYKGILVIFI